MCVMRVYFFSDHCSDAKVLCVRIRGGLTGYNGPGGFFLCPPPTTNYNTYQETEEAFYFICPFWNHEIKNVSDISCLDECGTT